MGRETKEKEKCKERAMGGMNWDERTEGGSGWVERSEGEAG